MNRLKVVDFLGEMNKRRPIKTQRLIDLKGYYVSMYRVNMVKLYNKNYIDDPTRFNEVSLRSYIQEQNIKGMVQVSGVVELSSSQVLYALYKNKGNEEIEEFLSLLYDTLKYREYCRDINRFYDGAGFSEMSKCSVGMGLGLKGAMMTPRSGNRVSEAFVNCFLDEKHMAVEKNFNEYIWDIAMEVLGVPVEERRMNGLIDANLSHSEEIDCIELILEGKVESSGLYSDRLNKWLYKHKWSGNKMTTTSKGLYEYVFNAYTDRIFKIETTILNKLHDEGKKVYAVDCGRYYIAEDIKEYELPIGCFVVVGGEDNLLFDGSVLSGYTGEVYTEDYLEQEELRYVGCPFEVYVSPKEKILFYDLEQVDISYDTWFKSEKIEWYFYPKDTELIAGNVKFTEDSLEGKLYKAYLNSLYGDLTYKIDSLKGLESARKAVMKTIV